ncbi:MAG: FHA domain-containing protein [Lachnospiraceae bacterium]|nr:FHA domain-containing protein [Lachnospiraceae bacterium]
MLEPKYYRDYGHNYMILQCSQQETVRSYQYKILTSGKIGEILKCSVRHINGSTYYYYDISSRTTLNSLYRDKKMTRAQVKDILCQIHGIYEKLAGYFMEEAGLVLLPEHIYYDLTDKKYVGLYYPDYQAEESNTYRPLMDFLLEHIDTDDRNLTENMYRIYEMAEESCFFIEDALRILEDSAETIQETLYEPIQTKERESDAVSVEDFNVEAKYWEPEKEEKETTRRNLFYPVFAALSALGIVGAVAVRSMYELAQREEMILYGVVAAMGACLLLCLAGIFAGGKKKESLNGKKDADAMEDYSQDINLPSLENVINHDINSEMPEYKPQKSNDFGNTVFFDESAVREYKLYAMDKKNKRHIELKQFPCTVGKMAGCVDYVLADNSVSRIHARFDRQGDTVLLTDMNSTNGTFKNGLRMQPQETVEIEPGDEVRFGNLNYCYR